MKVFYHCHKAAGTTVVRTAIDSGLRLAENHRNGNPIGPDDKPINWARMEDQEVVRTLEAFKRDGVELICFEFTTPRWPVIQQVSGLEKFTVLRDPAARAFSNYRMDVTLGYCDPNTLSGFHSYMNGESQFRANNFYTRFFSRTGPRKPLEPGHLRRAIRNLESLDHVIVLETTDLPMVLGSIGLSGGTETKARYGDITRKKEFRRHLAGNSGVDLDLENFPDDGVFFANNSYDYAIYSHFLRRMDSEKR